MHIFGLNPDKESCPSSLIIVRLKTVLVPGACLRMGSAGVLAPLALIPVLPTHSLVFSGGWLVGSLFLCGAFGVFLLLVG